MLSSKDAKEQFTQGLKLSFIDWLFFVKNWPYIRVQMQHETNNLKPTTLYFVRRK